MEGFGRKRKAAKATLESVKEKLDYDSESGHFSWKSGSGKRWRGIRAGAPAGSARDKRGYLYLRIDGEEYSAQRLAWLIHYGEWPKGIIRFNDGNPANCSIANLRDAAVTQPTAKYDWRTKEGKAAQQREYRASIADRLRDERFQNKYGISIGRYKEMLAAQGGRCAICSQPESATRNGKPRWLAVDHCHNSNKVRGLLCGSCNPMIGYAKDNVDVLKRAVAYLEKWS